MPWRSIIDYVKTHGTLLFNGISIVIRGSVDGVTALLRALPSPLLIARCGRAQLGAAPLLGR